MKYSLPNSSFVTVAPESKPTICSGQALLPQLTIMSQQNVDFLLHTEGDLGVQIRTSAFLGGGYTAFDFQGTTYTALMLTAGLSAPKVGAPIQTGSTAIIVGFKPIANHLLSSVRFHLFSFPIIPNQQQVQLGPWLLLLTCVPISPQDIIQLGNANRHRVTSIGQIEKADGSDFEFAELEPFLEFLSKALTFMKGGWCPPALIEGFDSNLSRIWLELSASGTPINSHLTWLPRQPANQNLDILSKLYSAWADQRRPVIEHLINVYAEIADNTRAAELRIILAQTGLETLFHVYGFTGQGDAETKLKSTLGLLSTPINMSVPSDFTQLQAVVAAEGWTDGPQALVRIRNCVVHPNDTKLATMSRIPLGALREAADLYVYYAERMILNYVGYTNAYFYSRAFSLANRKDEQV